MVMPDYEVSKCSPNPGLARIDAALVRFGLFTLRDKLLCLELPSICSYDEHL